MINHEYIRKKRKEEMIFLWNHMTVEQQRTWIKEMRFYVKHRTLGRLYLKIKNIIMNIQQAFYLY